MQHNLTDTQRIATSATRADADRGGGSGQQIVERFAPSPTGRLHLGHAYSALLAHDAARRAGGRFLLRFEDLDRQRSKPAFAEAILEDLHWLGITPDKLPLVQSTRAAQHGAALDALQRAGLVFRCVCTRGDIRAAAAPQEGDGPRLDGPIYPGTCKVTPAPVGADAALRLHLDRALIALGEDVLRFDELGCGPGGERGAQVFPVAGLRKMAGDIVLRRRDGTIAYHLAVVVDDAAQGVTHVTRGEDLFHATLLHRLLQSLLGLPRPVWRHHRLIRDETGRRLAKRDDARSLAALRSEGWSVGDVRRRVGLEER
ncbi:MAG: tRNA glutamyl-Q(34) synthetase GluQRS [Pseudomonadota bacterium]